jgi:hypothetical protein
LNFVGSKMKEFNSPADDASIDLNAARPGFMVIIAGAVLAITGIITFVGGVQLLVVLNIVTWAFVVPYFMLILGVAASIVGGVLTRARLWAALVGVILAIMLALVTVGWCIYAILHGFLSPLCFIAAGASILSTLVVPVSLPSAISSTRARRALYS